MIADVTWQDRAACADKPTDMFFRRGATPEAIALGVCAKCPVLEECRAWTDEHEHGRTDLSWLAGIFGGETPAMRARRRSGEIEGAA